MRSPRLFAREVTGAERQQLTDAVRHGKSAAVARRCQMILMSRQQDHQPLQSRRCCGTPGQAAQGRPPAQDR